MSVAVLALADAVIDDLVSYAWNDDEKFTVTINDEHSLSKAALEADDDRVLSVLVASAPASALTADQSALIYLHDLCGLADDLVDIDAIVDLGDPLVQQAALFALLTQPGAVGAPTPPCQ